mmetsp:Transcript_40434/g.108559  ORF Transcript_40434/g.108559 Transcript_40434/m.108559 type:complete len:214 (+) Transcript_40434:1590-2231(+)
MQSIVSKLAVPLKAGLTGQAQGSNVQGWGDGSCAAMRNPKMQGNGLESRMIKHRRVPGQRQKTISPLSAAGSPLRLRRRIAFPIDVESCRLSRSGGGASRALSSFFVLFIIFFSFRGFIFFIRSPLSCSFLFPLLFLGVFNFRCLFLPISLSGCMPATCFFCLLLSPPLPSPPFPSPLDALPVVFLFALFILASALESVLRCAFGRLAAALTG